MKESLQGDMAWKVLFGEEFEFRDPSAPENEAFYHKKRKERIERFREFVNSPAGVLLEKWREDIKRLNIVLLRDARNTECTCAASILIKEIQSKLDLLIEAERITIEEKADK